jgi:hypothetical protein
MIVSSRLYIDHLVGWIFGTKRQEEQKKRLLIHGTLTIGPSYVSLDQVMPVYY